MSEARRYAGDRVVIPVTQTLLSPPDGNCFAACVASILELPIDAVPNYHSDDWFECWQEWLYPYNLALDIWTHNPEWTERERRWWTPRGYAILSTRPPGCGWEHCTVALDGKPVWNPMPGYGKRIGDIGKWVDWTVFRVLDPRRPVPLDRARGAA